VKEASPNPELVIPDDWPAYGLWKGERISLRDVAPKMKPTDLADVYVKIPGIGMTRPWKGSDYAIESDGDIVL
jgi:hypothetical protein